MTWKQVKIATLQKMFSADGQTINENDENTKQYVEAMPQAANEALQMLCTAGKYLRKSKKYDKESGESLSVNLKSLSSFYRADPLEVYRIGDDDVPQVYDGATLLAGRYLIFPKDAEGTFEFFYDAWPDEITSETGDDEEIDAEPEVAVLLPLYMASQLYKDDSMAVSTTYRNEFEAAFERLKQPQSGAYSKHMSDITGWC